MAAEPGNRYTVGYEPTESATYDGDDLNEAVEIMLDALENECEHLNQLDDYFHGRHARPYMPREASKEYKLLSERSITNVLPMIIDNIAQLLYVEDYTVSADAEKSREPDAATGGAKLESGNPAFQAWQFNRMDLRQAALYRSALQYGVAYAVVTKKEQAFFSSKPESQIKVRGVSPRNMIALYEDPANDEWPVYALELVSRKRGEYRLYDDTNITTLFVDSEGDSKEITVLGAEAHGGPEGICPVVRVAYNIDLEGRYHGEIEPQIPAQDRLNQTMMDRLLVQTFASWKVRTISGMSLPDDDVEARQKKMQMAPDRFLVSEDPDTKFGSLPETSTDGFIRAAQQDQEVIAATAAVPPHALTGTLNNLGAEAIAEARASLSAKADECRHAFGEAMEQILRLCSWFMGDSAGWEDYSAQVVWKDTQNRSLAQVVDALGKMVTMLDIPPRAVWNRIPGVTSGDVAVWSQLADDEELSTAVQQMANPQQQQPQDEEVATGDAGATDPSASNGGNPGVPGGGQESGAAAPQG